MVTQTTAPECPEGFPPVIWAELVGMADRVGTDHRGPWEDANGEPMQDDAEAAMQFIAGMQENQNNCLDRFTLPECPAGFPTIDAQTLIDRQFVRERVGDGV